MGTALSIITRCVTITFTTFEPLFAWTTSYDAESVRVHMSLGMGSRPSSGAACSAPPPRSCVRRRGRGWRGGGRFSSPTASCCGCVCVLHHPPPPVSSTTAAVNCRPVHIERTRHSPVPPSPDVEMSDGKVNGARATHIWMSETVRSWKLVISY